MSIQNYIAQLNEQEKEVLAIAKDHLEDSFDIERSLGYQDWKKTQFTKKKEEKKDVCMSMPCKKIQTMPKKPRRKRLKIVSRPSSSEISELNA